MPKRKGFGCSLPVIIIGVIVLALFIIAFLAGPIGRAMLGPTLPEWLSVPQPEPHLPAETVFHLFGFPITNTIITSWITIAVLVIFSVLVTSRLRVIPRRWQALLEFIIESLLNFCQRVAGEKNGRRFFPIVATIFLFVIFNAWLGLLPGYGSILIHTAEGEAHLLRPANTDVNVPLALALVSFVFVSYFGLKTLGMKYIGNFINLSGFVKGFKLLFSGKILPALSAMFMGVINLFIGFIEGLSQLIRIVSFTFRLFGNMTAGEILLLMAAFLLPFLFADVFYILEILVGFVQALIFGGLTLIFLTVAVSTHGEEHHEKEESKH